MVRLLLSDLNMRAGRLNSSPHRMDIGWVRWGRCPITVSVMTMTPPAGPNNGKRNEGFRQASRDAFSAEVLPYLKTNHDVRKLTEYQYRIDGVLDLYPTRHRWHLLSSGERGGFRKSPAGKSISHIEELLSKGGRVTGVKMR
jgi:hypothetical protein